jgi:glucoamylase
VTTAASPYTYTFKDAVGTAQETSRIWFAVAQGIVIEVYYPRPDIQQLKDLGFIVADDKGWWIELRRLGNYSVAWRTVMPASR